MARGYYGDRFQIPNLVQKCRVLPCQGLHVTNRSIYTLRAVVESNFLGLFQYAGWEPDGPVQCI